MGDYNIERNKAWEHEPERFTSNGTINIYYDKPITLGQYLENGANKPDIVIHNKEINEVKIIEVGITGDTSITSTTHRKILKYTEFKNVIKREWKLEKADFIPVITVAQDYIGKN